MKSAAFTYQDEEKIKEHFESFRNKLKLRQIAAKKDLFEKHPHALKFFEDKGLDLTKIREHSAKLISASALAGTLFFNPPTQIGALPAPREIISSFMFSNKGADERPKQQVLVQSLGETLPAKTRPLSRSEEKNLEQIIGNTTGVKARATLEGEHLNTTYGLIGAEQHLRRFPGDNLGEHGTGEVLNEGIAPGLGAWGYFAPSKRSLTPDLVETEKWYAVAQTLYLPDWGKRQPYLRDWYKYRKVLIINTKNGNAVVAAIADSGPAAWTGKHFGGSPEVMDYLGGPRYKKGPVIFFFVDDPENKVPLGPVEYNK